MMTTPGPDDLAERVRRAVERVGPGVVDLGLAGATALMALLDLSTAGGSRAALWACVTGVCAVVGVVARRWLLTPAFVALVALVVADAMAVRWNLAGVGGEWALPRIAPLAAMSAVATPTIRRTSTPLAGAAAAAGACAVVLAGWAPGASPDRPYLFGAVAVMYLVGAGAGVYLRDLDRQRRETAERARSDIRLSLARDLHDLVAHHVTAIVVQAQAGQVVAATDPDRAAEAFRVIEETGRTSLDAMRDLVGSLRSISAGAESPSMSGRSDQSAGPVVAPTAPTAGLGELERLADPGAAPPVTVTVHGDARRFVPDSVATTMHRITREALTNARRHAIDATRVAVDVWTDDAGSTAVLRVADDGRARPGSATGRRGYGLVGMRERAQLVGGTFAAGPLAPPDVGWCVEARFPLVDRHVR